MNLLIVFQMVSTIHIMMIDCKICTLLLFLESSRNEYRQWINSLQKAWALVGQDLKIHGNFFTHIVFLTKLFILHCTLLPYHP